MNPRDLPYGAREIAELRTLGQRPADMVLVSLIGPLREANPVIVAKAGRTYDWRFLVGLSVLVVAHADTPGLPDLVQALEEARPASLGVWWADHQDGINLLIGGYRPCTRTGRRMGVTQRAAYAGLGASESRQECLQQIARQVKPRAMANVHRFDATLVEMATAGFRRIFGRAWEVA